MPLVSFRCSSARSVSSYVWVVILQSHRMPWTRKNSNQPNPSAIMTETKRIIANGHYKIENASVKLDKRRLVVAPKHAVKFDFDDISQPFATESSVGRTPCRIRLLQCDCLEAAELLKAEHGTMPLVLDFASGSNPGGVKRNQQGTQEEDICRQSSLLPSLEQQDYPLPSMGGIYAPDICVFRGPGRSGYPLLKEPFWIAILAAEMPNLAEIGKKERIFIQGKIQGVLHMALRHGHSSLVLGAWGCGAFGNDARTMAAIFKDQGFDMFRPHVCFKHWW